MNTYLQENGKPEPKSACRTGWTSIHEKATQSKKGIKSGPWRSKVHRHPEESRPMSPKTAARKVESAARIARYQASAEKYRIMIENPLAKKDKSGAIVVQNRVNGRFQPKVVLIPS